MVGNLSQGWVDGGRSGPLGVLKGKTKKESVLNRRDPEQGIAVQPVQPRDAQESLGVDVQQPRNERDISQPGESPGRIRAQRAGGDQGEQQADVRGGPGGGRDEQRDRRKQGRVDGQGVGVPILSASCA